MSIASFTKEEFQSLLNLLHRVEVKGIAEAQALLHLATKLDSHVKAAVEEAKAEVEASVEA